MQNGPPVGIEPMTWLLLDSSTAPETLIRVSVPRVKFGF